MKFEFYYECKHSFGTRTVYADTKEIATEDAKNMRSKWCPSGQRCTSKVKLLKSYNQ